MFLKYFRLSKIFEFVKQGYPIQILLDYLSLILLLHYINATRMEYHADYPVIFTQSYIFRFIISYWFQYTYTKAAASGFSKVNYLM